MRVREKNCVVCEYCVCSVEKADEDGRHLENELNLKR